MFKTLVIKQQRAGDLRQKATWMTLQFSQSIDKEGIPGTFSNENN